MDMKNLEEEFNQWNPMENDYKSKEFNQYNSGPGANLDVALQSYQQVTNNNVMTPGEKTAPVPYLLFKKLPPGMTRVALHNICQRHGRVTAVRDSKKNDYFFADFATVADMEGAFRALEHNNYGFTVHIGRQKSQDHIGREQDRNTVVNVPPRTTGVSYDNRTFRISSKQQPRPIVENKPIVGTDEFMGLPSDIINNDAHSLEREGVHKPQQNQKFLYRTGRSYIEMPQFVRDLVNKKHSESSGRYSPSKEMYTNEEKGCSVLQNFKKCVYCNRLCDNICSRCSTYYCGIECQKNDWHQHRHECGKPNISKNKKDMLLSNSFPSISKPIAATKNARNKNSSTEVPKETKEGKIDAQKHMKSEDGDTKSQSSMDYTQIPRSGNIVTITAISKTNIVFIRSKTYEANMLFFKTIDGLQSEGDKLKPLSVSPECGTMVVAKFHNQFNRALVLKVNNPEKIFVNYVDYGNWDTLKLEDLYEVPQEYLYLPRHAIPVMLRGVPDCYMTEEIRIFMYSYLNGINVYIKYKAGDYNKDKKVYEVELIDETTQQNLNKMICKFSKPTEPVNTNHLCYQGFLDQKLLPTGNNIELIVMDNSIMSTGCISCTTKPFAIEIHKFQKEIQKYAETVPKKCYAPRADELCIAKYSEDGQWYRGRCLEVVGDGHPTILFIDFGNISMVHINDIRRYPSQFTYSVYTADCEIQGLPELCSPELVSKLEELIPHGSTVKCEKVVMASEEDYFYSISLPSVIQKLKDSGLL